MKLYVYLWQYVAEFFSEIEIFQQKRCRENQNTHFVFSNFFSPKILPLWENVEKYGTARQGTYDNITGRRRFACWINNATNTLSEYLTLFTFPVQLC
jgi:hypothetical protein